MKKRIGLIAAVLFFTFFACAQETEWKDNWMRVVELKTEPKMYLCEDAGFWTLTDAAGAPLSDEKIDGFGGFEENGLGVLRVRGKWGVLKDTGELVAEPVYSYVGNFVNGRARVEMNGNRGFIDESGFEVIPPQYYRANDFIGDYAAVASAGQAYDSFDFSGGKEYMPKWGVIDRDGNVIVPLAYESVRIDLENRAVYAQKDGAEYTFSLESSDHAAHETIPLTDFLVLN